MDSILQAEHIAALMFNHLPIIAAFFFQHGLVQYLDSLLPNTSQTTLSHGQCILLYVCDCLFGRTPLHLYPDRLGQIDLELLFGPGTTEDNFNEFAMGETLDAIAEFGEDRLFSLAVEHLRSTTGIKLTPLHATTMNFSVLDEYDNSDFSTYLLYITDGKAKDKQKDLRQCPLLMLANAQGIPVAMKTLDGNSNNLPSIGEEIKALQMALGDTDSGEQRIFVTDTSFFTSATIGAATGIWISNVPDKLKEVHACKDRVDVPFRAHTSEGYRTYGFETAYAGVRQRWVLVHSDQLHHRQLKSLLEKQNKELEAATREARQLRERQFGCESDAHNEARSLAAKFHLLNALEPQVSATTANKEGNQGHLEASGMTRVFSISATFEKSKEAAKNASGTLGRFVLATNDLGLSDTQILEIYLGQQSVERGFRFLKESKIQLPPAFLQVPGKVRAMSFVMGLSLLVYALIENQLRSSLAQSGGTIHIQSAGPAAYRDNAKPTLRKVFALFQNLSSVLMRLPSGDTAMIQSDLSMEAKKVLELLGPVYEEAFERK